MSISINDHSPAFQRLSATGDNAYLKSTDGREKKKTHDLSTLTRVTFAKDRLYRDSLKGVTGRGKGRLVLDHDLRTSKYSVKIGDKKTTIDLSQINKDVENGTDETGHRLILTISRKADGPGFAIEAKLDIKAKNGESSKRFSRYEPIDAPAQKKIANWELIKTKKTADNDDIEDSGSAKDYFARYEKNNRNFTNEVGSLNAKGKPINLTPAPSSTITRGTIETEEDIRSVPRQQPPTVKSAEEKKDDDTSSQAHLLAATAKSEALGVRSKGSDPQSDQNDVDKDSHSLSKDNTPSGDSSAAESATHELDAKAIAPEAPVVDKTPADFLNTSPSSAESASPSENSGSKIHTPSSPIATAPNHTARQSDANTSIATPQANYQAPRNAEAALAPAAKIVTQEKGDTNNTTSSWYNGVSGLKSLPESRPLVEQTSDNTLRADETRKAEKAEKAEISPTTNKLQATKSKVAETKAQVTSAQREMTATNTKWKTHKGQPRHEHNTAWLERQKAIVNLKKAEEKQRRAEYQLAIQKKRALSDKFSGTNMEPTRTFEKARAANKQSGDDVRAAREAFGAASESRRAAENELELAQRTLTGLEKRSSQSTTKSALNVFADDHSSTRPANIPGSQRSTEELLIIERQPNREKPQTTFRKTQSITSFVTTTATSESEKTASPSSSTSSSHQDDGVTADEFEIVIGKSE